MASNKQIHPSLVRGLQERGYAVRRVVEARPERPQPPPFHGCAHPRAPEAFARLARALEYALLMRAWIHSGFVADWDRRNNLVQIVYTSRRTTRRKDGTAHVKRARTVATRTLDELTELACTVLGSAA